MDHGVLVGECRDLGLLKFPYLPPQEYDYSVELAGTSSEWLTGIQASHNDVSFQWVAGATKGGRSHLDSLEKSDVGKTESNYVMKENRTYHWRMEVRNTGIRVFVDNELVCSYATDFHEFSGLSVSKEDGKKLGVSAWWNKVEIRKAEVTEYGVPGRVTRGTP